MTMALFDQTPAAGLPTARPAAVSNLRVAGIDVSLTGTAIATLGGTTRIATKGRRKDSLTTRHARLQGIARQTFEAVGTVDLAVIEGPSHHSVGGSTWDRGGLWWLIVDGLLDREIPTAVMPPTCRAKYATGSGAARKAQVIAAINATYGLTVDTDDEADAIALRAAGLDWAGTPLAALSETHRGGLLGCEWPEFGAVSR